MMSAVIVLAVIVSIFMGISIGASSVPPAFGPVRSSGFSGVLQASLIAGIAAALGAFIQGGSVTKTVGSGIVSGGITELQAFLILFIGSALVIVSVVTSYPMPTAFTVVGAVIGSAYSFGNSVNFMGVSRVVGYWISIPFLAVAIGFVIAKIIRRYIDREKNRRAIELLTFLIGLFVAFTAGANSVGLAVGPLQGFGFSNSFLLGLGAFSILAGALILSPKIVEAVSFEYSNVGPRRSIAGLGTAAILAQIGVLFGIPISFNEAIIAAIIGSGMVEGSSNIGKRKMVFTVVAWISAFLLSIILTYGLSELLFALF